ncbi:MAG: hypothetical protein CEO40_199 [Parcubacteria group bacterium LiPW_72]|nr:MAG: hypothetical protein CEO40_199 [Parcubacteria group bacterium LiPW_72]
MRTEQEIQTKLSELEKELAEIEEGFDDEIEMAEDDDNAKEAENLEGEKEIKIKKLEKQVEILKWILS